ncbi:MAG TPA: enoyl-CoA hydratase [Longimicrobiaceae bacterium]|nr:enoyl-CoA hydratase [Longimicrobiaceae bacterium]
MSEHVLVETRGPVLHLRLNRPEKKNALTVEMYAAMADALAAAEDDPAVRAVLLSAEGDAFTGGNDLADFLQRPPTDDSSPVLRFLHALIGASKPLVAAVNGLAVGIGTTLLLHCDLVYAGRSARFHLPFVSLGLVPEAGSSLLVPQRVGQARAAELLLLGEPFDAERALEMGIVSAVFPDADLAEKAEERALRLAAQPPAAVRATRALLRRADRAALQDQMREESALFLERLRSPEAREAMQAFLERRQPDFSRFH